MSHTNLVLGTNWKEDEWPAHVEVSHEGEMDNRIYKPEHVAEFLEFDDDGYPGNNDGFCSRCMSEIGLEERYCHICGAKIGA